MKITEIEFLRKMIEWLRARLSRPSLKPLPRRTSNLPKTAAINREDEGAFFYLRDVLDRLGQCQKMVRKLRQCDSDAYQYHRRVGAKVLPEGAMVKAMSLWPELKKERPSQGMTLMFEKKGSEYIPKLFYFTKLKQPIKVQCSVHEIFHCVAVFNAKKNWYGITFYIAIDEEGKGNLLRENISVRQRLPGSARITLNHTNWEYSKSLLFWHKHRNNKFECTLEEFAFSHFCLAANWASMPADDELLVRCSRGNITAAMNVSTKRTPYFFKDRDTTLAVDGKRKRIFHIVRAHTRCLGDGRISEVKEHYRGERIFAWGGHQVVISVPAHQDIAKIPVAMIPFGEDEKYDGPDLMSAADAGDMIVGHLEA